MNSSQAGNAPMEITLGGKTYLVSQLTRAERRELDRWVQGRIVEVARLGLDGATAEDRKEIMGLAFDRAVEATWSASGRIDSLQRISRLLWQYIKARYPNVTLEQVTQALEDNPDDIGPAFDQLALLYHKPGENPTTPAETPATKT
jgi:hypothetical protein